MNQTNKSQVRKFQHKATSPETTHTKPTCGHRVTLPVKWETFPCLAHATASSVSESCHANTCLGERTRKQSNVTSCGLLASCCAKPSSSEPNLATRWRDHSMTTQSREFATTPASTQRVCPHPTTEMTLPSLQKSSSLHCQKAPPNVRCPLPRLQSFESPLQPLRKMICRKLCTRKRPRVNQSVQPHQTEKEEQKERDPLSVRESAKERQSAQENTH